MRIAFLTTIFPIQEECINDFFNSLLNQTCKKFDLIVVNDNFKDFNKFIDKFDKLNIIEIKGYPNIAKNREVGINYCIENKYDILIFGDIDDYFQENRIDVSLNKLIKYDIVVNDLTLFNKEIIENRYISNRLENNLEINFEFIKNKNIFGLSNTAINIKDMSKVEILESIEVVDWYLFSTLLLKNKKAIFTNETTTFYRQYDDNLVGLKKMTIEAYKKGINVKKVHYSSLLKKYDNEYFKEELFRLSSMKNYELDTIIKRNEKPLWWELI